MDATKFMFVLCLLFAINIIHMKAFVSSEEVDGLFCTGILKCENDKKCIAACKADGFKGGAKENLCNFQPSSFLASSLLVHRLSSLRQVSFSSRWQVEKSCTRS
ncbi:unnamed protein product [Lactuca virosa]|uniref:Defensin-like protein n=1 Tax=Lactuca virosa TaxID=75947 RepID=A0AAU9NRW9_9ASTR|nr:unnamed protein product [Lactuca virosa]